MPLIVTVGFVEFAVKMNQTSLFAPQTPVIVVYVAPISVEAVGMHDVEETIGVAFAHKSLGCANELKDVDSRIAKKNETDRR